MGEVRDLFIGGLNIRLHACIVAAACLVFLLGEKADIRRIIPRTYQIAFGLTVAAAAALGIASVIDFNAVFVQFHHIFYDMVMRIGGLFVGMLLVLLVLSLIPGFLSKKKAQKAEKID